MIVGNDVSLVGHDHPGTERILHQSLVIWIPKSSLIAIEKFEEIEPAFTRYGNLLGGFHRDDGRDYAADERSPLPVQGFQRSDLFRIHTGLRRQRILLWRALGWPLQPPVFEAVIVEQGNSGADHQDKQQEFGKIFHQLTLEKVCPRCSTIKRRKR